MAGIQTQIASDQLNLVPGHVVLVESDAFGEAFVSGLDCLTRELTRVTTDEALAKVVELVPDVVLYPHDSTVAGRDAEAFLIGLRDSGIDCSTVVVVPGDQIEAGGRALQSGAVDFLVEAPTLDQVAATLSLVATTRRLQQENDQLLRRMNGLKTGTAMVGCGPAARRVATVLARAAESSVTVLIEGAPGTGKTLAAQIIHTSSRLSTSRMEVAFADSLTAARTDELLRSTTIGTLLLQNVEQLLPEVQSKVVRYIKESSGDKPGVRIIATTSAHLPELVARGKFREDLYYRLNVFPITMPSLRERREDITLLADHFLKMAADRSGEHPQGFTEPAIEMLEAHTWTGNAAQLQDAVFRAHALAKSTPIDRRHLHGVTTGLTVEQSPMTSATAHHAVVSDGDVTEEDILPLETEEKRLLARALRATQGNVRRAAQLLRIGRATLYRKIQVYKLKLN